MNGYASRKFLITGLVIACATGLALMAAMDANVALVFGSSIAAYNWANVRVKQNGSAPDF